jgi:hypothetical protein
MKWLRVENRVVEYLNQFLEPNAELNPGWVIHGNQLAKYKSSKKKVLLFIKVFCKN